MSRAAGAAYLEERTQRRLLEHLSWPTLQLGEEHSAEVARASPTVHTR